MTDFANLKGMTLASVTIAPDNERVRFVTADGRVFDQWHSQSCCESVRVEDVVGDLSDLIGSPILLAEEVTHSGESEWDSDYEKKKAEGWPEDVPVPDYVSDSFTWTFYKLSTIKGSVTIRWLGESNGYYSESVDFDEVTL